MFPSENARFFGTRVRMESEIITREQELYTATKQLNSVKAEKKDISLRLEETAVSFRAQALF
jgi:hypothetical protein